MTTEREVRELRKAVGVGRAGEPEVVDPGGIVQFAVGFLGLDLYPRQATLLKLMTLDVEALTNYDRAVLAEWSKGFQLDGDRDHLEYRGTWGVAPDILDRVDWCRARGRRWFREIVLVMGRRGSKSLLGSIVLAWRVWSMLMLWDPQQHYQIPPRKTLTIPIFGTDQAAAQRDAFGDVARLLTEAPCFKPFIGTRTSSSISILTPSQLANGAKAGIDDGSILILAAASTSTGGRGPTTPALWFDEFAHVQGAGSTADSITVYSASVPATAQFSLFGDDLIIESSSPWEKTGQLHNSYARGLAVDPETGSAKSPDTLAAQFDSAELYIDAERASEIQMWQGGPHFKGGMAPKVTREYIDAQLAMDPERGRVEWLAQFGAVRFPYLRPDRVEAIFAQFDGRSLVQMDRIDHRYACVAHADPSLSNSNFGFAIGHLEPGADGRKHVVFDLLVAWRPSEFPDGIIDYDEINSRLFEYLGKFRLQKLTFDQYSSAQAIQHLRKRAQNELSWRVQIEERTATVPLNIKVYENFKTAVHAGFVHAPHHDLARDELLSLAFENRKVVPPSTGPIRTKDLADAMAHVVYTLTGEATAELYSTLGSLGVRGSLPGWSPVADPESPLSQATRRLTAQRPMHGAPRSNRRRPRGR